jgi:hypothetical protein
MPRRNRKNDLDFEIHRDRDSTGELVDEGIATSTQDFAARVSDASDQDDPTRNRAFFEQDNDTLLNEDNESRLYTNTTDSTMTRTSTLVDGETERPADSIKRSPEDETEHSSNDKLDRLNDEAGDDLADGARSEISLSKPVSFESFGESRSEAEAEAEPDTKLHPEDDDGTQASIVDEEGEEHSNASESRRESGISEFTASRRESGVSEAASGSRRESGITGTSVSRRESGYSNASGNSQRRTSGRTEALIQAAARDIVAQINLDHGRDSLASESMAEDQSYRSHSRHTSARPSDVNESFVDGSQLSHEDNHVGDESIVDDSQISHEDDDQIRDDSLVDTSYVSHQDEEHPGDDSMAEDRSYVSGSRHSSARPSMNESVVEASPAEDEKQHEEVEHVDEPSQVMESIETDDMAENAQLDEGADSSSHHENDDDVFSDHSPRSSVGSLSEAEQRKLESSVTHRSRSPRVSDFSHYDYREEEEFIPTVRGTPRPAFRSPSSVKAMQMSSPPPSVLGSPRSSRRTPLPTVSRLGSPRSSTQYSPKKTPPRFKRDSPPLVLLHATLLPLQWPWAEVLEDAAVEDLSQDAKGLRESWRQLQDRMGDTVRERGILLPHPQNDFEVLEERLLEALELPMRRRARILECGHYLGPANETTLTEETDSEEDEYDDYDKRDSYRRSSVKKSHWCGTCRCDIKYEDLGPGKIFRVKVYASNGLMKAGAWEACWKEMERIDVELEPLVESSVQDELSRLAAEQDSAMELQEHREDVMDEEPLPEEPNASFLEPQSAQSEAVPSSPPVEARSMPSPPAVNVDEERRRRDEERLREIYGESPPTRSEPEPEPAPPSTEYSHRESPPSPSQEAFERREQRRYQTPKNESLPDLLMEAFRVAMQDRKNVMIALLSILVLSFAVRGGNTTEPGLGSVSFQPPVQKSQEAAPPTVTVTEVMPTIEAVVESLSSTAEVVSSSVAAIERDISQSVDPCSTASVYRNVESQPPVQQETIRVVETVTETAVETTTVKETQTQTWTETTYATESVVGVAEQETPEEGLEETLEEVTEEEMEMKDTVIEREELAEHDD